MSHLMLRTFGGLEIHVDGKRVDDLGSRKTCALLVYLAVGSQRVHQRTHLAGLLWPDRPESTARTYLRQSIARLKDVVSDREAGAPILVTSRQTVEFCLRNDFWFDAAEIVSGLAGASEPGARAMTPELAHQFGEALELYNGSFLEGFTLDGCPEYGEWQLLTGEYFRRLVVEALTRLSAWHRQQTAMAAALSCARRRVELDPLSEAGQRQYMRFLAEAGEINAALAAYDQYCDLLLEDLHSDPAPATTRLAERIRAGGIDVIGLGPGESSGRGAPLFVQQGGRRPTGPFVGRERELEVLAHHLSAVLGETRQGRTVFVTGEAGQGKTELLLEFARRASTERDDLLTVVGQGMSHGEAGDPLAPFRQILAQLIGDLRSPWATGHLGNEPVQRLWNASTGVIRLALENAPDLVDALALETPIRQRAESLPRAVAESLLSSLPRGESRTGHDKRQSALFEQYTRLLISISERWPLLLLLDDLHWADLDSLSLLLHLGHALAGSRILVLGAFRAEEVMHASTEGAHPLQMVYQELQRYGYAPVDLNEVDGRAFVDALLDREPNVLGDTFRSILYGLTGGSPLFTSELLYSMQESADLVRTATGAWAEAPSHSWDAMPSRVEAVLGRRVAQLTGSQRALLMAASVQGDRFVAEAIADVLGTSAREVVQELSGSLARRHRLVFAGGLEHVGESTLSRYQFRHALFQQYLYAQLDAVERGRLHELTARALESIYAPQPEGDDPVAATLAWHWEQSGFAKRAAKYHSRAGDWAVRLSAYARGLDHYERGLALLEQKPDRFEQHDLELELLARLADVQAMVYGGASDQVERTLARARSLSLGDWTSNLAQSRLADSLWAFYHQRGENQQALRMAQSYLDSAEKANRSDLLVLAHSYMGTSLTRVGRLEPSLEHFVFAREAADVYMAAPGDQTVLDTAVIIGVSEANVLWYLGYPDQAHIRSATTIAMAEEKATTYRLVFALIFACGLYGRSREWRRLAECAERTHTLSDENGFKMWSAVSSLYRAWALAFLGDCQQGVAQAVKASAEIAQTELFHVRYLYALASVYATCGRVQDSLATVGKAMDMMEDTDEREWEPEVHRLQGELILRQDRSDEGRAERCYRRAVDVARSQRSRMLELRALTSLCGLRTNQDQYEAAYDLLAERYSWFTEGFDAPDLVDARRVLDGVRHTNTAARP